MRRPLTLLAWLNVALHGIALLLADRAIRPGSPLVPLPERLAFLTNDPGLWRIAWASWMLCAVALIAFLVMLAKHLGPKVGFGLAVATAGMICDLSCDLIYILVLPRLTSGLGVTFLAVERITGFVSMTIANGAYSMAILLFTLAMRGQPASGKAVILVGCLVAGFGFLLALAGITGVPWHAEWATVPTIVLFCVWCVLVARALEA